MISVVVCSRLPESNREHRENVDSSIDVAYEYLRIDNTENHYGICQAYNRGTQQAQGDIVVFVHEDVWFLEKGWGKVLESKFNDPLVGVVGVAGTQYLFADTPYWIASGSQYCRGRVLHHLDNKTSLTLTVFSWEQQDSEVVVVDGLFIAVRRTLLDKISFDEKSFPGFHFYDLDICMQARKHAKVIVTWNLLVKHDSGGTVSESFLEGGRVFLHKWNAELPAQSAPGQPVSRDGQGIRNYQLKPGTVPASDAAKTA